MTEDTVGDGARSVKKKRVPQPRPEALRGIQRGIYTKADELKKYMGWSREAWEAWRAAGLRTQYPGTKAEHVYTDWVIDFFIEHPEFDAKG